jgi:hypothetical protein
MKNLRIMAWLIFGLAIGALTMSAAAQTTTSPVDTAPAPAFGQNSPILSPENPPVTGLDEPALDLRTSSRSFIAPAFQVSESADTNGRNQLGGGGGLDSVTRVLGAFDLQKFWPKSDLFAEYLGGGAFYADPYDAEQLHSAGVEAVTRWRTGQATIRDSFSYLPDGSFQIGFGGLPGIGLANGGGASFGAGGGIPGTHFFGSGDLGAGATNIPRLANTGILDMVQAISPVSAFTVAGGFSDAHFFDSTTEFLNGKNIPVLVNSDELTIEGGYSHLINRHDQIGLVYAFQLFQFPASTGGQIYIDVVNVRYSHNISNRLSFLAGVGPQYTDLQIGGYFKHWSVSGRAQLRYKIQHGSLTLSYEKFTSSGSGLFGGANVQEARVSYTRPVGRTWEVYADLGYSHNTQIEPNPAINATGFDNGSAGVILRKHLNRSFDFFATYRFGELALETSTNAGSCIPGSGCGRLSQRQVGAIGMEWHPKPTRIE